MILLHNNIPKDKWIRLLETSSFTSPFQTPEYFAIISKVTGFMGEVFALSVSETLKILMVVTIIKEPGVMGLFTRRGIIFGGPVISQASKTEMTYFLSTATQLLKRKAIYLETRNFFDYTMFEDSFKESRWVYNSYLNVKLNLDGITKDSLFKLFKYNRRREIKQSILNGASYSLCSKEEDFFKIYQILKELYFRKVKLPLPSLDFFRELYKVNILKVFIVKHDNYTIGGSFCMIFPGKNLFTFYYCGIRDYNPRIFPTHLAVVAALEFAIDNKIPLVDFMGAGQPNVDYGVRKYKLEFGGDLVDQGRFLNVLNPLLYKVGKWGLKFLSKLHR
jgi:lipid II:glycine glycyltransferase (peptidoglycan interpeptide bridge formation enzyme)